MAMDHNTAFPTWAALFIYAASESGHSSEKTNSNRKCICKSP